MFRLCRACAAIVGVKNEDFTCACCDGVLPRAWNFGDGGIETGERLLQGLPRMHAIGIEASPAVYGTPPASLPFPRLNPLDSR